MKIFHCILKLWTLNTLTLDDIIALPALRSPSSCLVLVRSQWIEEISYYKLEQGNSNVYLNYIATTVLCDTHFFFQMVNKGGTLICFQIYMKTGNSFLSKI